MAKVQAVRHLLIFSHMHQHFAIKQCLNKHICASGQLWKAAIIKYQKTQLLKLKELVFLGTEWEAYTHNPSTPRPRSLFYIAMSSSRCSHVPLVSR
jgi:hypothetical protein